MSTDTNEETMPQIPASEEIKAPPARKRAAKKTAAKKTAAKKVAAKKTAKKSSEPVAVTPELPFEETAPAPKKRATRAKKTAPPAESAAGQTAQLAPEPVRNEPTPVAPSETQESTPKEEPKRFGRVPGGGPLVPRSNETPESEPEAPAAKPAEEPTPASAPARQPQHQQPHPQNRDGQPRESRSKRRREKRKRRLEKQRGESGPRGEAHPHHGGDPGERRPAQLSGPKNPTNGILELAPKGFGFLRLSKKNFEQARDDVFVPPEIIRRYNLRLGQWIHGFYQEGQRGPQLVEITSINGMPPEDAAKLPHFDELKAINPSKRISFETDSNRFTTRVVDIMAPVGRGQRGLIVSPPRSGKTTLLLHMAEAIREKYEETMHLMVLLVDERPEEVTEFRRALPGAEIYASSNDEQARNHCRIAELAIERAKRLVEAGKDVFLLMDSITRLARAYNNTMNNRGRGTGSGGITIGALEVPRRLFAAARNTRGAGSLTILATALIQTNSRADEAIFMEFKGTGNMELVLDRKIAENYIYPAVDIFKSGTRREELLLPEHMLHKIHLIRRGLSGHRPMEAMERLLFFLKKFPNNPQMLLEIKG
jgi:transcription termination factor Rho